MSGRSVLRVSVTELCDLACRYCRPEAGAAHSVHLPLPSLDVLSEAVAWLVRTQEVSFVKVTGGESLIRPRLVNFVERLSSLPGIVEVSMTTNGTRLASLARPLASAGLRRVNVSLDTLDPGRFFDLTRGGDVRKVLGGIDAAIAAGLRPVKLNAVLRRSSFQEDVPALLDFAARAGLELRLIELMRTGSCASFAAPEFVSFREAALQLSLEGQPEPSPLPSGPAERLRISWKGRDLVLGAIQPVSHAFCGACNRMRLDARGWLRRCLMDPEPLPLLPSVRHDDERLLLDVDAYLGAKRPPVQMQTTNAMTAIGG